MATDGPDVALESQDETGNEDSPPRRGGYFPKRYLTDFFEFLKRHRDIFQILTYADLPWGDDTDYKRDYPVEWRNWKKQLARGERDPNKIYIIIQYDVDSRPERTMALLREPAHELVPANIMIFNRRIDRKRLRKDGTLSLSDYALDIELLQRLESRGFVVGYHTNAYERSCFDVSRALEIFDADVKELSRHFHIRYFSAHGGVPDAKGRNNRNLPFHPEWVTKLKWVHNGHRARLHGHFSDGGHNSPRSDPQRRDLRAFVSKMIPGRRYGILLHPQYYGAEPRLSPRFGGIPWYDDLIQASRETSTESLWQNVHLSDADGGGGKACGPFLARIRTKLGKWL